MHQPQSGQTPSLSLLKIGRRGWRASEQQDSELSTQRGHAGLQWWWWGGHLPVLTCQTCCPGTPSRSPCARRQAGAGRCRWFPSAYFLVATTTHQKVHQYLYHQTSQSWWQEVCVTRAFGWAWRAGDAAPLSARAINNPQADVPAQSHSVPARGTCNIWLLALRAANIKMPSWGFAFYPSCTNFRWSLCKMSHYFV